MCSYAECTPSIPCVCLTRFFNTSRTLHVITFQLVLDFRINLVDSLILIRVHVQSVAYDLSSAPKEFQVYGWREMRPADRIAQPSPVHRLLGEFTYDTDGSSVQTFHLSDDDVGDELINMVRLHVLSNHGSPLHTCIYRFRVHGVDPQATL